MVKRLVPGLRNNNPLNIEHNSKNKWQGLAEPPYEGRFCRYVTMPYGVRAGAVLLVSYQDRYDLRTIHGIISRWAPPVENDTEGYAKFVAGRVGVDPHTPIDLHSYEVMFPMIAAMAKMETGIELSKMDIDDGLLLAGIKSPPPKATKDPVVKQSLISTALLTTPATVPAIGQMLDRDTLSEIKYQLGELLPYYPAMKWGLVILGLASVGSIIWHQIQKSREGRRA